MENKNRFPTVAQMKADLPEGDPARLYLDEIGHLELLSEEEEQRLAQKMLEGSKEARETLIEHNLLRVAFIARQYLKRGMSYLDLLEEGNRGLIEAADQYREDDKYPFFGFAAWHIHKAIIHGLNMCVIDRRIPFTFMRIDDEKCVKNPAIFRDYLEMPRSRPVDDLDWVLITLRYGLNCGRGLHCREILDMTGVSSARLDYVRDKVTRMGRPRREIRIREHLKDGDPENEG